MMLVWAIFVAAVFAQGPFEERFLEIPDGNLTFEYLRDISDAPSLAGTYGSFEDALYVSETLQSFGLPQVEIFTYNCLLSYPISSSLEIIYPVPFKAVLEEPPLVEDPSSQHPDNVPTFLGYSASGDITSDLIYVNYGRPEDFRLLVSTGIQLEGKIAIARYGQMFRGLKVLQAQEHGMAGIIIFSDPFDDGYLNGPVYPEGPWRPPYSVQRGNVRFSPFYSGDMLTPKVAAVPELSIADRKYTYETCPTVPRIPAIPLGYGDAEPFLRLLDGIDVTENPQFEGWQGGLPFSYHVGGTENMTVRLQVENEHPIRPEYNVVATIPGNEEPDRQILIGNHRDAWTSGARDPHAGTAPLLEVARAFGILLESGWRPRRTIKLMSWDGEEYGLHGSVEYAEQFQDSLDDEAVVYLNVDTGAQGLNFGASGSPSLGELLREVTKQVINPITQRTVYDEWLEQTGTVIGNLGSGSDYTAYLDYLGIASMDMGFGGAPSGVYHSIYDTHYYYSRFIENESLELCTKVLGLTIMKLADYDILPFDYREYGDRLEGFAEDLIDLFGELNIQLNVLPLQEAIQFFKDSAAIIELQKVKLMKYGAHAPKETRELNDRLMMAERSFLSMEYPLYRRDEGWYRHVIYAPSYDYGYLAVIFPGVTEAAQDMNVTETSVQLDILVGRIISAGNTLQGN